MKIYAQNKRPYQRHAEKADVARVQEKKVSGEFEDNRPETAQMVALQSLANDNDGMRQLKAIQRIAKHSNSFSFDAGGEQIIQRVVNTMGGEWDTTTYDPVDTVDQVGAQVQLEFTPNDMVDATKIALVQTSRRYGSAERANLGPVRTNRMIPQNEDRIDHLGEQVGGTKIDRVTGKNNPIYGGQSLGPGEGLENTNETSGRGHIHHRLGHRYVTNAGTQVQNAMLHDTPTKSKPVAPNSGHTFETTALAIDGTQRGTFYGSVKWGWRVDNGGAFSLVPFRIITNGAPTRAFLRAAERWRTAQDDHGNLGKALPTANITPCYFEVEFASKFGEDLYVVGNKPEIGDWNVNKAVKLEYANPNKWQTYVGFNADKAGQDLQYKYLVKENGVFKRWDAGGNHMRGNLPVNGEMQNYHDVFNYG